MRVNININQQRTKKNKKKLINKQQEIKRE